MRLLLLSILIVFLAACANPAKLLEQGKYAKALEVSTWQLKNGRIKAAELAALESSFYLLTQRDSLEIARLRSSGRPEVWPDIYEIAGKIQQRQSKIQELQDQLSQSGYFPDLPFYPATALREEAAEKSALYFYARAQESIPAARNGDRKLARTAHEELTRSLSYIDDFRDAPDLLSEMRDLGTTHLLLLPGSSGYRGNVREPGLLNQLYWNHRFPERMDWLVVHNNPGTAPFIDFEMDFFFVDVFVGFDQERVSSCTNSVEVEDGFKLKKVWSEKDSAYIEIKEIIYKTVSATVETIEQSKEAGASLQLTVYDPHTNEVYSQNRLSGAADWYNVYSRTSGDDRAMTGSCTSAGGMWCSFPFDSSMLEDAVDELRWPFWRRVAEVQHL
ncbi:hypothetical protein [Flavilitoribacter nigricans]|uniref:Uncharacterized protein n=1 Tax=Flavilitoribacter nigricans (strain ATCC 23147 / DSM 23189 / NBRC 102662 / NCIMB 1420 / SS-2) TaxID=1122177 RepID=A0A2D0MWG3_FLAN2|nr:hypothetical protein [Flavilitoribacter nigricans]PHN00622.1 hypothetical protein CRP01_41260 [Flavilitoribacter nigricans DSM 23189 = NBRC 102662]